MVRRLVGSTLGALHGSPTNHVSGVRGTQVEGEKTKLENEGLLTPMVAVRSS